MFYWRDGLSSLFFNFKSIEQMYQREAKQLEGGFMYMWALASSRPSSSTSTSTSSSLGLARQAKLSDSRSV